MSDWNNQIPHAIINGVTTINSVNIVIEGSGSLIIDIDMNIIGCTFYSGISNFINIESEVSTSANTEFLPCDLTWRGLREVS